MKFYIVRHGMAKSKEDDPERSLNEQGISETKRIADFLKPLRLKVDAIYHSGKARSKETADIIAASVESAQGVKQRDGIDPDDDVKKFAKEIDKGDKDIMIAGHQPFLGRLIGYMLIGDQAEVLVTPALSCAICFERDEEGRWLIQWMVIPEILT